MIPTRRNLFYELRRMGNAVEMLAIHADRRFTPMDEGLRLYRDQLLRRNMETEKTSDHPEQKIP